MRTIISEEAIELMIQNAIGAYHKENVGRFDTLTEAVGELRSFLDKAKGSFFALCVIGGAPTFIYYCIRIVKELRS